MGTARTESFLAAQEAVELLVDAGRVDIGGEMEQIADDDSHQRRERVAALVQSRLDAGDLPGALATADRHRARSLVEAAGVLHAPSDEGLPVSPPADDASLGDQIGFVAATARALLGRWGVPPPLDGTALSNIVGGHGRTCVLLHPMSDKLRAFVVRPGGGWNLG